MVTQIIRKNTWDCQNCEYADGIFRISEKRQVILSISEALPGVLGNRGARALSGNKGLKLGEQRQFWGTGNMGNQDFDFGEQGNKAIYFRGTRIPWEDIIGFDSIEYVLSVEINVPIPITRQLSFLKKQ